MTRIDLATFAFESVCSFGMFKFKMWLHNAGRVVKRKGSACRSRCFCCPGEACVTHACCALHAWLRLGTDVCLCGWVIFVRVDVRCLGRV